MLSLTVSQRRCVLALTLASTLGVGLQLVQQSRAQDAPAASPTPGAAALRPTHELLNATLWVQESPEWQGLCLQSYALAAHALERALANPERTAALEQAGTPRPALAKLPPAVILDVDETVLDNSYYEARLIRDGGAYGPATWDAWCKEESATPIPGALEFCRAADAAGVTVFYVTNRKDHLREATRNNLRKQGFPLREGVETVRTRTKDSDKGPRRSEIAQAYRIVLLVGDNGADFCSPLTGEDNALNRAYAQRERARWGAGWILIPNPMYGQWENNVVQRKWGDENDLERLRLRRAALRGAPGK